MLSERGGSGQSAASARPATYRSAWLAQKTVSAATAVENVVEESSQTFELDYSKITLSLLQVRFSTNNIAFA